MGMLGKGVWKVETVKLNTLGVNFEVLSCLLGRRRMLVSNFLGATVQILVLV